MISSVIEDFRYGVTRQKPDPCVLETARLPNRLEQRSDVVAQSEPIAVEKLQRIEHFTAGLFVGPSGDVIPEAWSHEAAVGEKEAPDSLRSLPVSPRAGAIVNALRECRGGARVDLAFYKNVGRVNLSLQSIGANENRKNQDRV